jgi:hypothetical protein
MTTTTGAAVGPRSVLRRHRDFARLWLGQVVSVSGDGMQRIALLWWAGQHGGTSLLVAVAVCGIVPLVALSPVGGWAADRYDRRRLMVAADILRVSTSGLLAVAMLWGTPPVALVCALVALTAVGTAAFDPTYAATVPTLVPEEDRPAANGLNLANSAAGGLVGPILGGLLLAALGIGGVLVVNAATFAWSALCVLAARIPAAPATLVTEPSPAAVAGSEPGPVRAVLADRQLRRLVALAATLNLVAAPVPLLIVSLADVRLGVGVQVYALLEAVLSAGVLVGALTAGMLAARKHAMAVSMLALGGCLASLGLVPLAGAFVALGLCGVSIAVANTALITIFQNSVAPEVQGRVFGVVGAMAEGLRPLGLLLAGPLLAFAGVSGAFAVVGLAVVAATVTWAVPSGTGRSEWAVPSGPGSRARHHIHREPAQSVPGAAARHESASPS